MQYIFIDKNFNFMDFFTIKVTGRDIKPVILFSFLLCQATKMLGLTSCPVTLTGKKTMKILSEKIYYIFS